MCPENTVSFQSIHLVQYMIYGIYHALEEPAEVEVRS